MMVNCGGEMASINDYLLKQLKIVCNDYCGSKQFTIVTVAVSTCQSSDLAKIRKNYGITWIFGNDYSDGKMDVIEAYKSYVQYDGTVVLIDKAFNVAQVYDDSLTVDTLALKINQLLGAR